MPKTKVQKQLYALQDKKYQAFSLHLLPPDTPLIGVRLPILRRLSKSLTLEDLTDDTFEEIMLQGMVIGRIQDFSLFQEACTKFLPKIKNWSVCDAFVASLEIAKTYPEEVFVYLESLIDSKEEFIRRFVIVMFLNYYENPPYIDRILLLLPKISKDGYYVEMAISWFLAELYTKNKNLALEILKTREYNLNRWIFKKTISKIKDSYRVSSLEKEELKEFQKKYLSIYK